MALLPFCSYYIVLFFYLRYFCSSFLGGWGGIAMYANDVETKENNNYLR